MRKLMLTLAAVSTLAMAAPAMAQNYISGTASDDSLSAAVGHDYGALRAEVAVLGLSDVARYNQDVNLVSVNGFVEPWEFGRLTPFVTAGVGYGKVSSRGYRDEGVVTNYGAGAKFDLTPEWSVTAEWRNYQSEDASVRSGLRSQRDLDQDVTSVGLRYQF